MKRFAASRSSGFGFKLSQARRPSNLSAHLCIVQLQFSSAVQRVHYVVDHCMDTQCTAVKINTSPWTTLPHNCCAWFVYGLHTVVWCDCVRVACSSFLVRLRGLQCMVCSATAYKCVACSAWCSTTVYVYSGLQCVKQIIMLTGCTH